MYSTAQGPELMSERQTREWDSNIGQQFTTYHRIPGDWEIKDRPSPAALSHGLIQDGAPKIDAGLPIDDMWDAVRDIARSSQ